MKAWPLSFLLMAAGCAAALNPVAANPAPESLPAIDVQIPFDLPAGRPEIMAQIGGAAPTAVEFDTGSQGALIPRALVEKLGLKEIGETILASPFGGQTRTAKLVSLGSLRVGGVEATDVTAVVQEDQSFMGSEAKLVIGPSQFADKVIVLDYGKRTLRIASSSPFAQANWQPLVDGLLETELVIEGQRVPMHVDSGNPGSVLLPKSVAEGFSPKPTLREVGRARTVDREFSIYVGTLDRDAKLAGVAVRLGDVGFADVPTGNLGSKGLSQFTVVIDLSQKRWQLIGPDGQVPVLTAVARGA